MQAGKFKAGTEGGQGREEAPIACQGHRTLSRPTPPKILRQLLTFVKRNETINGSPLRLGLTAHQNAIILPTTIRDGTEKGRSDWPFSFN